MSLQATFLGTLKFIILFQENTVEEKAHTKMPHYQLNGLSKTIANQNKTF